MTKYWVRNTIFPQITLSVHVIGSSACFHCVYASFSLHEALKRSSIVYFKIYMYSVLLYACQALQNEIQLHIDFLEFEDWTVSAYREELHYQQLQRKNDIIFLLGTGSLTDHQQEEETNHEYKICLESTWVFVIHSKCMAKAKYQDKLQADEMDTCMPGF